MVKALSMFLVLVAVGGLLYIFAALAVFNFFVPKDAGSRGVAAAIAYGPDPLQNLYIYKPTNDTPNLPTLIFVHGGSWDSGNAADYEFIGRAFAAKGFLTLTINYRKRPKNPYPAFIEDVASATAWAKLHAEEYGGDGKTIFLVGHSAGAYNVAMAVLNQSYMKNVGVDQKIIKGVATVAGPFDFLPLDSPISKATFAQVTDLSSTQPVSFARKDAPPFLILHDADDTLVAPKNAVSLYNHLRELGAAAQYKSYPNTNHVGIMLDIARPFRSRAPVLDDITNFFKDIVQR